MKGHSDETHSGRARPPNPTTKSELTQEKMHSLMSNLMEKEEEINVYKERLRDLESAFYYNLEIISERDLELSVLEKKLHCESEQLQQIKFERDELEDALNTVDKRNCKKIQQLEAKLIKKEDEIRLLQMENTKQLHALKRMTSTIKEEEQRKMYQMNLKFEADKKELMQNCQEKIKANSKYFLFEIDNLTGKLDEATREKVRMKRIIEENQSLKWHLADMERMLREQKNEDVGDVEAQRAAKMKGRVNREVQCQVHRKVSDKPVQATPSSLNVASQTQTPTHSTETETEGRAKAETETDAETYKKRVMFLQDQNEVLKYVIKDLKKNNDFKETGDAAKVRGKCEECATAIKQEIQSVNEKFVSEIGSIRKILLDEQAQRAEEDAVIQNLETAVTCLKNKLLADLQQSTENFAEGEMTNYTGNELVQNKIQMEILEEKLSRKIDLLITAAERERRAVSDKLEELKRVCVGRMDKLLTPRSVETSGCERDTLTDAIRSEMVKLENKIERNLRNMIVRNDGDGDGLGKGTMRSRRGNEDPDEVGEDSGKAVNIIGDPLAEKCVCLCREFESSIKFESPGLRRKFQEGREGFERLSNEPWWLWWWGSWSYGCHDVTCHIWSDRVPGTKSLIRPIVR